MILKNGSKQPLRTTACGVTPATGSLAALFSSSALVSGAAAGADAGVEPAPTLRRDPALVRPRGDAEPTT